MGTNQLSREQRATLFFAKAKEIHNDGYDYTDSIYVNNSTHIVIKCKTCLNVFSQKPHNHLHYIGCKTCSQKASKDKQRKSLSKLLQEFKEVHGDKYDYSYVDYKNSSTKVKIICKDHGVFEQTPHGHLLGKKCSKCRHDKLAQLLIGSKEKLQYKSNIVHNNEYEIIGEYIKADIKIKIKHLKCSRIIEQTPASHIQGNSCPFCSYSSGWSYSNWEKTAKNSKSFDSYKVYVIYCFNKDNNESFIKVGRTFNKIENRLRKNTKRFPYDFKIIKEIIFKNAIDCCEYERELLNKFALNSYEPLKHFNGKYECFNSNILVNIEDYLKEKEFSHSEIA